MAKKNQVHDFECEMVLQRLRIKLLGWHGKIENLELLCGPYELFLNIISDSLGPLEGWGFSKSLRV